MGEANINLEAVMEDLEQKKYALERELELATLQIDTLDEEMQLEVELALEEDEKEEEDIQRINRDLMLLNNREFTDSKLYLDTSSFNQSLSTSYLDASSAVNISSVMEASIHEPVEISDLTNELKEYELNLRDVRCSLEENQCLLQEIVNRNLITENDLKNSRQECQTLKEDLKELGEDIVLINSELSLLPRLKQSDPTKAAKENSIYDELVRGLEVTKTDLAEKKQRLAKYMHVMHQIETECKQIEGEILVLDVYDREDETRKLQSQANLLAAYKYMHEELEKNISTLQMSMADFPALIHSNAGHNPDLVLKTVSQYHEFINVKLKKLSHELTYHKMELVSVTDKESQLSANLALLTSEADKLCREFDSLGTQIEEIKLGRTRPTHPEETRSEGPKTGGKDVVKPKTVRFQTGSPSKVVIESHEEEDDKENDTSVANQSEGRRLKPRVEPQKIVIHKRRQNKKPVTIIKHY